MALAYTEFDQRTDTIVAGLKEKILASSDWAHLQLTSGTQNTTLSSGASAGATSISTAATIPSGSYITIGNGAATPEVRLTTAVSGAGPFTVSWVAAEPLLRTYSSSAAVGVGSYVKATTTRGAQMVVDLASSAAGVLNMTLQAYVTHDGTTAVGASGNRYMYWKKGTGAATVILHCRVSAHKDGLYMDVEGPRSLETAADSTAGSFKTCFYLGDIAPYDAVGDTTAALVLVGQTQAALSDLTQKVVVSRNKAANANWVPALLRTLSYPQTTGGYAGNLPPYAANGDYVAAPWVVFETGDGIRGRIQYLHYGGVGGAASVPIDSNTGEPWAPSQGADLVYGSFHYKAIYPFRTDGTSQWHLSYGFGYHLNNAVSTLSPVLWIPSAVYP